MSTKNCPSCRRLMNADLAMCPWCGATPEEPVERPSPRPPVPPPVGPPTDVACPFCHEPIKRDAVKCRWCGESLFTGSASPGAYAPPPPAPPPLPPLEPVPVQPMAPPGTLPLVLGIIAVAGGVALCGLPLLLAPFAWWTGQNYENQCRDLGVEPDGAGKAGKVLGIIGTLLLVLGCGCGGLWFMLMSGTSRGAF